MEGMHRFTRRNPRTRHDRAGWFSSEAQVATRLYITGESTV